VLKITSKSPLNPDVPEERWTKTDFPNFRGMKCLVLDGAFKGSCVALMAKSGFTMAKDIKEADLLVFTGGADVDPQLYGERNISSSFSTHRDAYELDMYAKALEWDVPMFGICRGFQFLAVMNGGKLWQHVNNHTSSHDIVDTETGMVVKASSIHHQMVRQTGDMSVMAVSNNPVVTQFKRADYELNISNHNAGMDDPLEIEAACWIETKSFGVQGHPELFDQYPEYASWSMHKLEEFLLELAVMQNETVFGPNFLGTSIH